MLERIQTDLAQLHRQATQLCHAHKLERIPASTERAAMTIRYLTIAKFSVETGYTEKAIRNKIHDGTWAEGEVWVKAADGRILIDVQGYEKWVETGGAFGPLQKALS
ncbi:hypothetical protein [Burkholderia multivorans]|uniref:hypothetical protein n=1 Tax=Burkholderia multivorans TaxID=87883 RepID=UPI0020B3F558|nr:hypothetical protein [Burkholderia multivorans]